MKNVTLVTTALICACLIAAGTASAERTPVAGFSPNFADPQPATAATLTEDANRLIRWQGWLDVDAFSASILEQMQKQLAAGSLDLGKFTLAERSIAEAVAKAQAEVPGFIMNENLRTGERFRPDATPPAFYVWTYRHNFADTGLYQLYISVKGEMLLGQRPGGGGIVRHRDIQSLGYEFGHDGSKDGEMGPFYGDVEIWRGAVVRVNARGVLEFVGNEAGVVVGPQHDEPVEKAPVADWERAPSLIGNLNYDPTKATGAAYVEPLERSVPVHENSVQKATGTVQKPTGDLRKDVQEQGRVRTISPFRYRGGPLAP